METLNGNAYSDPFPHLIIDNFYNEEEFKKKCYEYDPNIKTLKYFI